MGQGPSAPAVVNVGLPGGRSGDGWSQNSDDNKTRVVSDVGGLVSGVSRMLQASSTRLVLGSGGGTHGRNDGPDGWVDATVSTPLFPHGRGPAGGVERQARHQKRVSKFRVFADGVVFEGPEAMAIGDTHDLSKGYERLLGRPITRVTVGDKRAQQVLVAWADGRFWAVPSRQSFSRHLGVCLILGDKTTRGPKHTLRVGDILRLGSVGLLVSEICTEADGGRSQVVSQDVLDQIREDVHTAPRQVLAPLRKEFFDGSSDDDEDEDREEEEEGGLSAPDDETGTEHSVSSTGSGGAGPLGDAAYGQGAGGGTSSGGNSKYQCYICMDSEEEDGDVLIAPCQCKGSTALVHVKCLQRLLSTGDSAKKTNVISTKHQNHTCKICKARYKTHVKLSDGTLVPLLNPSLVPPYLTLVVITRHESHPDLFNTIFQLSFARAAELSLGRSQGCDLVIGYRTVSTRHATISYSKGEFHYQDARSSNGSLLYLRGPLEVPTTRPIRLRMGRSILSLRARQSLQLTALPRQAVTDAWRWLASSVGTGAGRRRNSSRDEDYPPEEGGPGHAGLELLRDLHMGRFQQQGESSILTNEDGSVHRSTERLMWHLDSSSSSIVDSSTGSVGRSGAATSDSALRRPHRHPVGVGEGGASGGGSAVWSTPRESLPERAAARRGGAAGVDGPRDGGEGEAKSSAEGRRRDQGPNNDDDDDDDLGGSTLPPHQPSLAHSDLVSAPSNRVVLQRTRSSRV